MPAVEATPKSWCSLESKAGEELRVFASALNGCGQYIYGGGATGMVYRWSFPYADVQGATLLGKEERRFPGGRISGMVLSSDHWAITGDSGEIAWGKMGVRLNDTEPMKTAKFPTGIYGAIIDDSEDLWVVEMSARLTRFPLDDQEFLKELADSLPPN